MIEDYNKQEGKKLLLLARESIAEQFTGIKPKIPDGKFQEKRGVFVTLTKHNKLRGCIGFPYPNLPLNEAVYKAAKSAAFYDPRFISLGREELNQVKIEISILSIPEQCNIYGIEVPGDGLMCECEGQQSLLLPQVAVEFKMDRTGFLEALCEKAGLDKEAYKERDFKLFKFTCQIFSE